MARPSKCNTLIRRVRSIRLTDEQWQKLQSLGTGWLIAALDSQAAVPDLEPVQAPQKAIEPARLVTDRDRVLQQFLSERIRASPSDRTHKSDVRMAWLRYAAAADLDDIRGDALTDELPRLRSYATYEAPYYMGLTLIDAQ